MTTSAQPKLIGLGGKLRSGKDAFADYLVEHHGYVKMGMSDILHESAMAMNPIVDAYIDNDEISFAPFLQLVTYREATEKRGYVAAKEEFPEYRAFLQRMGTEFGRNIIDEDLWVDLTRDRIDDFMGRGKSVVVTGIRFPNEIAMIREGELGFSIWINRPGLVTTESHAAHASETGLTEADFDIVVQNDGDLDELYAKAKVLA